ncbi:hypothetical protein F4803DRAFT_568229 [Xylaria telfairii]|nr:hypothetical protein F4803DRAFT_568229 [Xylaria telfairii]
MDSEWLPNLVSDLHRELARKYHAHGPKLKQLWQGMGQAQREKLVKTRPHLWGDLQVSQQVPKEQIDKFTPEWNLKDLAAAGSDFLLRVLEHRATKSLEEQCQSGFDDCLGDLGTINEILLKNHLQPHNYFPSSLIIRLSGDGYGRTFEAPVDREDMLAGAKPKIEAGCCVPQSIGEIVLMRQVYLLQCLTSIVDGLLSGAETTAPSNTLIKPSTFTLNHLLNMARGRKASFCNNLAAIRREPTALSYLVNKWSSSRPELVADERGRREPAHNTKSISRAFLDMMHSFVKGAAIWNYICRLLEILEESTEKSHRHMVLQELSNVTYLEYGRVQSVLRRQMFRDRWFKRITNAKDNGNVRIVLKGKPEVLADGDQLLHCLLCLCQPETTALKAPKWIAEIAKMDNIQEITRGNLYGGDIDAIGHVIFILVFISALSHVVSVPTFNRKSGRRFTAGAAELGTELDQVKAEIDLADLVTPINGLVEQEKAKAALAAFDEFVVHKTGTKMGFHYQDLVYDSLAKLRGHLAAHTQREAAKHTEDDNKSGYIPFPTEPPKPPEVRVQKRRQKEKTRPAHSSVYEIPSSDPEAADAAAAPPPPEPFIVKPAVAEVFSTLFDRTQSHGSIPWASFEAALAELKFSVIPKVGSAYTFFPPENMAIQKPVTLHRPHKSRIERHVLLVYARRLNRLYGWGQDTFQTS